MTDRVGHIYEQPALCLVLFKRVDAIDRVWWRVLFLETGLMMSLEESYLRLHSPRERCT